MLLWLRPREAGSGTTGTGAAVAPLPTVAASGTPTVIGTGTAQAPLALVSAVGVATITGVGAAVAPLATVAASGTAGASEANTPADDPLAAGIWRRLDGAALGSFVRAD
jgi:hypothetical protein